MTQEEIKKLWGDELYKVFSEHINNDGWLTSNWADIIEDEISKYDSDYNENPLYTKTYSRMYNIDLEMNSNGTMVTPFR